ncbi:MAG: hypothetical protein ABIK26_00625 [Candidatus Omnitrophota bacterium]
MGHFEVAIRVEEQYIQNLLNVTKEVAPNSIIGSISYTCEKPHKIFFSGVKSTNWNTYSSKSYFPQFYTTDPNELNGVHATTALSGRGILIPINVLKKLNYFDEKFVQYGSDTDFCYRALKKGINIVISWDAKIFSHWKETGLGSPFIRQSLMEYSYNFIFNKYSSRYLGNNIRMLRKHFNPYLFPFLLIKILFAKYKAYFRLKNI